MTYLLTSLLIILIAAIIASFVVAWKKIKPVITEIQESQKVCQNRLVNMNLAKLISKVEDHDIMIRGIGQIETIADRLEENAKTYQKVVIDFTEKVTRIDEKLTEMNTAFTEHRQEQTDQLKGIFDRLKRHDRAINEMKEKLIQLEREINEKRQ